MKARLAVVTSVFFSFVMIAGCGGAEAPEPVEPVADTPVESAEPAAECRLRHRWLAVGRLTVKRPVCYRRGWRNGDTV